MPRVPKRVRTLLAVLAMAALAVATLTALEHLRCRAQMNGDATSRPGSNCGYLLTGAPDEFRYAIDEGSERILYLSGGSKDAPEAIRLVGRAGVVAERATVVMRPDSNIDVCRNQPPRDARWWSLSIDDEIALALRTERTDDYRLEGLIGGRWQPLRVYDSGCRWHGHG